MIAKKVGRLRDLEVDIGGKVSPEHIKATKPGK